MTGRSLYHPSGPVGTPRCPSLYRDLSSVTLAAWDMSQVHGISLRFMELVSGSWNMVSFMEYGQFHGLWTVSVYLHGRLTGLSTRRRLFDPWDTVLATIRLKARKVSAC